MAQISRTHDISAGLQLYSLVCKSRLRLHNKCHSQPKIHGKFGYFPTFFGSIQSLSLQLNCASILLEAEHDPLVSRLFLQES